MELLAEGIDNLTEIATYSDMFGDNTSGEARIYLGRSADNDLIARYQANLPEAIVLYDMRCLVIRFVGPGVLSVIPTINTGTVNIIGWQLLRDHNPCLLERLLNKLH